MRFKAIVFDLDDTLYPERHYTLSGFRAVSKWAEETLGVSQGECFADLRQLFDGGFRSNTFDRWLDSKTLRRDGYVDQMVGVFRAHHPEIRLDDSTAALLIELGRDYSLGVVTDGYLEVQRKKVTVLGLKHYVDVIVFSDEFGRDYWKPSVRPFQTALDGLQVSGDKAVYVADNPEKDFFGARVAGMGTIRLRRADGVYGDLEPLSPEWGPDAEIDDLVKLGSAMSELERVREVKG